MGINIDLQDLLKGKEIDDFVDREEALNELHTVTEEYLRSGQKNIVYIAGIGGIGKTRLLEEYIKNIRKRINTAYIDAKQYFEIALNFWMLLRDLALEIKKQGGKLELFDFAYILFARLYNIPETKEDKEYMSTIRDLVEWASFVPGVGELLKGAQLMWDTVVNRIRKKIKERNILKILGELLGTDKPAEKILEILVESREYAELALSILIIHDINKYTTNERLVIIIDSIEYIENASKKQEERGKEIWINGQKITYIGMILNLIKKLRKTLIIVAGRTPPQKLNLPKYTIELTLIDKKDIEKLLEKNGIEDPETKKAIIETSGGWPILAKQLIVAYRMGATPQEIREMKGETLEETLEKVVKRLEAHMDQEERKILYTLALTRKFTVKMLSEIADTHPRKVKRVIQEMTPVIVAGKLHETISKTIEKQIPPKTKKQTIEEILEWIQKNQSPEWIPEKYRLLSQIDPKKAIQQAKQELPELLQQAQYEIVEQTVASIQTEKEEEKTELQIIQVEAQMRQAKYRQAQQTIQKTKPTNINQKAYLKYFQGQIYLHQAKIDKAIEKLEEAVEAYNQALKRTGGRYIYAWNNKGNALQAIGEALIRKGEIDKAIEKLEEAVEACNQALKRTGGRYIYAWNNKGAALSIIGMAFIAIGDFEGACRHFSLSVECFWRCYELAGSGFYLRRFVDFVSSIFAGVVGVLGDCACAFARRAYEVVVGSSEFSSGYEVFVSSYLKYCLKRG